MEWVLLVALLVFVAAVLAWPAMPSRTPPPPDDASEDATQR